MTSTYVTILVRNTDNTPALWLETDENGTTLNDENTSIPFDAEMEHAGMATGKWMLAMGYAREEVLNAIANSVRGFHMDSPTAKEVLAVADWTDFYPIVDEDGDFTGDILRTDDNRASDYDIVDWDGYRIIPDGMTAAIRRA